MFIKNKIAFESPSFYIFIFLAVVTLLIGAALPIYIDIVGYELAKFALIPALLILVILFIYSRKLMFVLIILTRASGDLFFDGSRLGAGGVGIGIGGLINAFVILISLMLILEDPKTFPRRYASGWFFFLLITLYGSIVTPVVSDAIRSWLALVSYFSIFISAFTLVKRPEDFKYCVKLVMWSSLIPVLYSFVDIALNHSAGGTYGFRLKSTFPHANMFAFYLTLNISLFFYALKTYPDNDNKGKKIFLVFYLFLLFGLLLLTKTRSAWISCLVTFVLYALFFERRYFLYLMVLLITAVFIPGVSDRLSDLSQGNEVVTYSRLNSFAWRVYVWSSAFKWTMPQDYLFGHGMQSFREYAKIFFPMSGGSFVGAHSVYVQYLFEIGLIGTFSYLFIFYQLLKNLSKMITVDKLGAFFVIIAIVSYLLCSLSDNMLDYLSFNWYLWLIIGAGCACIQKMEINRNDHAA